MFKVIRFLLSFFVLSTTGASFEIKGLHIAAYLTGRYQAKNYPKDFVLLPEKISQKKIYLHKDTAIDFIKMYLSAKKQGVELKPISGFRSFEHQKSIWNRKYEKYSRQYADPWKRIEKILRFSAMPGTSRHHWGTDVDIYSLNNKDFETTSGKRVYRWLKENGHKYGFYQVYTAKRKSGYLEEKWHYTHLPTTINFLKLYKKWITPLQLTGFSGDEFVKEKKIISKYVFSINPELISQNFNTKE